MSDAERDLRRAEARRLGDAIRLVIDRIVATRAPAAELHEVLVSVQRVAEIVEGWPQGAVFEGFAESSTSGDPQAFLDNSPVMGRANPLAPPLVLTPGDGRVDGRCRFGRAYEGAPGHVHGGYVAAAFDEVLGMVQAMTGNPGMTGTLTVRYRAPTPLHAELRFEGELDRVDGRKIFTVGRLFHGDVLCAEADAVFISIDFDKLAELDRQRRAAGAP